MSEKTFVPLIEGRLDPEVEGRTPIFILALTHGTRVVALPPDFAARDDHLGRAQALVRAHHERYLKSGPHEGLPIVGYRYFPVPDWGFELGVDGALLGTLQGRPIEAGFSLASGERVGFALPDAG
ncbi:hypothetical protein [Oceanithermus sp.]